MGSTPAHRRRMRMRLRDKGREGRGWSEEGGRRTHADHMSCLREKVK